MFDPNNAFHQELAAVLRDMAQAAGAPLGGFGCTYPALGFTLGDGNEGWRAFTAKVNELLKKHRTEQV